MTKISVLLLCLFFFSASGLVNGSSKHQKIGVFELKKGDLSLKVTNWGATILSLILPDKNGKLGDVILGYKSIKDYTVRDKENLSSSFFQQYYWVDSHM
ncbi:hypothetical protein AHAS_Ahas14G0223200 [Arachis hypogaea]